MGGEAGARTPLAAGQCPVASDDAGLGLNRATDSGPDVQGQDLILVAGW